MFLVKYRLTEIKNWIKIISLLKIQENKNDLSLDKLILKTEKNNIEILKDSKGRVNTYRLIIKLEFSIDNNKGKVEKNLLKKSDITIKVINLICTISKRNWRKFNQ